MKMAHTPGRLSVVISGPRDTAKGFAGVEFDPPILMADDDGIFGRAEDITHLLRCWNVHYELVGASQYVLTTLLAALEELPLDGVAASRCPIAIDLLRAVIKKLEGEY